jgi:hypothetical protein
VSLLQGQGYSGDVAQAESDGVAVHAVVCKGQLLGIPNHPSQTLVACHPQETMYHHLLSFLIEMLPFLSTRQTHVCPSDDRFS